METQPKPRVIRPKFYEVKSKGGAKFFVKAKNDRAARRYIVDTLEGALEVRAVQDEEAFELGRNGVEVLDAMRKED